MKNYCRKSVHWKVDFWTLALHPTEIQLACSVDYCQNLLSLFRNCPIFLHLWLKNNGKNWRALFWEKFTGSHFWDQSIANGLKWGSCDSFLENQRWRDWTIKTLCIKYSIRCSVWSGECVKWIQNIETQKWNGKSWTLG